ncbi:MAG: VWA-like domain-containing protein [Oscillospiraceae bacterium]
MKNNEMSAAAAEAIKSCRNALSQLFPLMIPALYVHELVESKKVSTLTSDYSCIYYSAEYVAGLYKENKFKLCALLLHTILHCMFTHQTQAYSDEELGKYADASVQLIMERISPLLLKKAKTPPVFVRRQSVAEQLSFKKLLGQAGSGSKLGEKVLELCREIQILDDHSAWSLDFKPADGQTSGGEGQGKSDISEAGAGKWQNVLMQIAEKSDELSAGLLPGCGEGSELHMITPAKDCGISYDSLIERYLKRSELSRFNPEDIDMPSYTLGMELYGNIPLVEESEVKDDLLSGNIIIALDTSSSCSGTVLENFVTETMSILDRIPAENRTVRIINCDDRIQSELVIRQGESCDIKKLCSCRGFGGTDFRPVFKRAEELNVSEGVDLLIYFTDACGFFPKREPKINSLILINGEEYSVYESYLPKWADAWQRKDNKYVEIRK